MTFLAQSEVPASSASAGRTWTTCRTCPARSRELGRHDAALDESPVQVDAASRAAAGGPPALRDPYFMGPHLDTEIACLPRARGPAIRRAIPHHLRGVPRLVVRRQLQRRATARPWPEPSEDAMDVVTCSGPARRDALGRRRRQQDSASERTFAGVTDEQMRVRPREDLNSLAWLMWHIARARTSSSTRYWARARSSSTNDGWAKRLAVTRRDFASGWPAPRSPS